MGVEGDREMANLEKVLAEQVWEFVSIPGTQGQKEKTSSTSCSDL